MTSNGVNNHNKGLICNIANGDLDNANTSYTYFNVGGEGYKYFSVFFPVLTATTLTLEVTNDDMTVKDADANWSDVTLILTGAANATATGGWFVDTPCLFRRARVKRVTTNATNALKLLVSMSE